MYTEGGELEFFCTSRSRACPTAAPASSQYKDRRLFPQGNARTARKRCGWWQQGVLTTCQETVRSCWHMSVVFPGHPVPQTTQKAPKLSVNKSLLQAQELFLTPINYHNSSIVMLQEENIFWRRRYSKSQPIRFPDRCSLG